MIPTARSWIWSSFSSDVLDRFRFTIPQFVNTGMAIPVKIIFVGFTFRFERSFDSNRNLKLSFLYLELKLPFNARVESRWVPKYLYHDVWLMLVPLICTLSGAVFLTRIEVPKIMVSVLPFFKFKDRSMSVSQLWTSRISRFSFFLNRFWVISTKINYCIVSILDNTRMA